MTWDRWNRFKDITAKMALQDPALATSDCVSNARVPPKLSSPTIVVEATNLRRGSESAAWWIQLQRYLEMGDMPSSGAVGCILC